MTAQQTEQALGWWIIFVHWDKDALHYTTYEDNCENMRCHPLAMDVYGFTPIDYKGTNKSLGSRHCSLSCPRRLCVVQFVLKDNSFEKILKWSK